MATAAAASARQGSKESHAFGSDLVARIDNVVRSQQQERKIPGLSVALVLGGEIRYERGFGSADLENAVPISTESRFRIASIAKPLTATAAMQLAERGALDLDAPIQEYCPAFPVKPWPITARQLLGHLAGIRHYTKPGESSGTQHFFSIADSLSLFKNDPLLHEPGTKFSYSTYGFTVLGCAIEGASKMSYPEYMRANVFVPAGMTHTDVDDVYQIVPNRVRGYQMVSEREYQQLPANIRAIAKPNTVYNAVLHDTSMKMPAGGIVSTPGDLARFAIAMLDAKLVSRATVERMWTSQKTTSDKDTEYGYGFEVQIKSGALNVWHGGNQAGASGQLRISPSRRAAVIILTNLEDADLNPMANAIIATVLAER